MENLLFSIIIPVYNVEQYLSDCLNSVLSQIVDNVINCEIILVDDGSTDGSGRICDEYEERYKNVKVIHQSNHGLLAARRTGLKRSHGDYIVNLDSDDLLVGYALTEIKKIIEITKADIIFINLSRLISGDIQPYYEDVFTKEKGRFITKEEVLDYFFMSEYPVVTSMAGKIIRRDCFDINYDYSKYGKLSTGEDTLQTAEVVSNAQSFYYLNENLYLYRVGSGMSAKFDSKYYETFKAILKDACDRDGFADKEKYKGLFREKVLSVGCRAVTQSKFQKDITYLDRKSFLTSIATDKEFIQAEQNFDYKKSKLKKRYKLILALLRMHAYYPLHLMLKLA